MDQKTNNQNKNQKKEENQQNIDFFLHLSTQQNDNSQKSRFAGERATGWSVVFQLLRATVTCLLK